MLLAAALAFSKAEPPCAARIECDVSADRVPCAPRLRNPAACGVRSLAVEDRREPVESSPGDERVRLLVRDAATGELLSSPVAYILRRSDGSAPALADDHPAILRRSVAVHPARFDGPARTVSGASAAVGALTVQGRIEYQDFPVSPAGYLAPVTRAARQIDVAVTSLDRAPVLTIATRTDAAGAFRIPLDVPSGGRVAVSFTARSAAAVVQDNLGKAYTWTTPASPTPAAGGTVDLGTVTVLEADDAGALNILDVVGSGWAYVISRGGPAPPPVVVTWKRGLQGGGTFYDPDAMRISLLSSGTGPTDDTDEWDDQVIAHEYAHHIERTTSCNLSPGGAWSICDRVPPELAWSEGAANYLSLVVSVQDPQVDHAGARYLDAIGNFAAGSRVVLSWDLESDSCGGAGGTTVPGVVSNLLWDLQDAADDPPDAFSRDEGDLYRLFLDMRGQSRCDLDQFLDELCRRDPNDLPRLAGLCASYGVPAPTGCELPARIPPPAAGRRRAPRPVSPRPAS